MFDERFQVQPTQLQPRNDNPMSPGLQAAHQQQTRPVGELRERSGQREWLNYPGTEY